MGVIRVTNAMQPLRRSAHPRIVNQSSHVGSLVLQTTPGVDLGGISGAYAPTKTFLHAVTIQYAKELSGTNILINNARPGYVATDLNGFSGTQTPEQGPGSDATAIAGARQACCRWLPTGLFAGNLPSRASSLAAGLTVWPHLPRTRV
ncbi:hypothetical protein GCM10010266_69510 [Streptomyces griseomycini]|nr:hypothetical protein GCM10010266_69510 [Streptomyces griseomycini]GGR55236.1 hypothetical protein GCM10015536_70570 [Streptomyces griseomycini]